jgi:hypothetical protein
VVFLVFRARKKAGRRLVPTTGVAASMGNAPCLMNTLDGVPRGGWGVVWPPHHLLARLAHPRRLGAQVLQLAAHPAFPMRWLAPGEVERGAIVYRFM